MSVPQLDPGLAAALQTDPRFSQPPPPPAGGVEPIEYARQRAEVTLISLAKYYGERLPPGKYLPCSVTHICPD